MQTGFFGNTKGLQSTNSPNLPLTRYMKVKRDVNGEQKEEYRLHVMQKKMQDNE